VDRVDSLIVGDYGLGAYGPTIILKLMSRRSAGWLHGVLAGLAEDGGMVDLAAAGEVRLHGVRSLKLRRVVHARDVALRGPSAPVSDAEFEWELDQDGWTFAAGLLEPFLQGKTGHQYLTREGLDAALIEVTFGESDVRVAGQ
jgi:hypothetical protein